MPFVGFPLSTEGVTLLSLDVFELRLDGEPTLEFELEFDAGDIFLLGRSSFITSVVSLMSKVFRLVQIE